ncbi:MAG: hypothetical protein LBG22_10230 [Treponema sp.]|jgi:hypothetical protein|nr:hypothetical protein [Treponema sp.]
MKSKKYLQLGMEAGPSWLILESDIPHVSNETGLGLGINAIVAMDFNPVSNGPHFQLCGDMMYAHINGGSEITAGIFLKVAYKKAKKILDSDDDIDTLSLAAGIVLPVLTAIGTWIGYNMIPSSDRS